MNRGLLTALLFCIPVLSGYAQHFTFSPNCTAAYHNIVATKLDVAGQYLDAEATADPDNLVPVLLEDYLQFVRLYLNRSDMTIDEFDDAQSKRIQQIRKGPTNSPYYTYAQARINLHYTLIAMQHHEYVSSFWSARKAYKLLEQCLVQYPGFKPAEKDMAILRIVLGVIPDRFQWGLHMLGMRGDLARGNKTLEQLSDSTWLMRDECIMTAAMLFSHVEGLNDEAWKLLEKHGYPLSGNLFSYYITADVALYDKQNEVVIQVLKNPAQLGADTLMPYLYYLSGLAHLQKLDTMTVGLFNKFLANQSNQYHVKSAYQKLAWYSLIQGDTSAYRQYMNLVLLNGATVLEIDKQAQDEAEKNVIPNIGLLKGRVLFDGGYYDEALASIAAVGYHLPDDATLQVEYYYRLARVHDEMGLDSLALQGYDLTISKGRDLPVYYADNAALKAAWIYEQRADTLNARKYYNLCLEINGQEYQNSLHQKARAGLERLD